MKTISMSFKNQGISTAASKKQEAGDVGMPPKGADWRMSMFISVVTHTHTHTLRILDVRVIVWAGKKKSKKKKKKREREWES